MSLAAERMLRMPPRSTRTRQTLCLRGGRRRRARARRRLRGLRLPFVAHSALELRVRVQLYDDVAALRRGEGDRVRRFAVVLLLRVDERVVAHLSLVVSEDGLCAALGGADAREVPPERHAFRRCAQ